MTTVDPRWARSRESLIDAVAGYLEAGQAPSITDVVATAGLSRPTFYQHFGDLTTAYSVTALDRVQREFDRIAVLDETATTADRARATLLPLLTHLADHRLFYCTALRADGSRDLHDSVISFIAERLRLVGVFATASTGCESDTERDHITVLAAGLFWLISHWLETENPDPVAAMTARLVAVITTFTLRGATV